SRLRLPPRSDPRAAEVPRQAGLEGRARRRVHGAPARQEPGRRLDLPQRQGEPHREDEPPLPVPDRARRAVRAATTDARDLVLDPYLGVGTSACAAVLHGRRAAGAENVPEYVAIARERLAS